MWYFFSLQPFKYASVCRHSLSTLSPGDNQHPFLNKQTAEFMAVTSLWAQTIYLTFPFQEHGEQHTPEEKSTTHNVSPYREVQTNLLSFSWGQKTRERQPLLIWSTQTPLGTSGKADSIYFSQQILQNARGAENLRILSCAGGVLVE